MLTPQDIALAEAAAEDSDVQRYAALTIRLSNDDTLPEERSEVIAQLHALRERYHGPPGNLQELALARFTLENA